MERDEAVLATAASRCHRMGVSLALSVWREGSNGDIAVKQLDLVLFALTPLTFTGDGTSPVWTADGRSIMYSEARGKNLRDWRCSAGGPTGLVVVEMPLPALGSPNILEVVPTLDTVAGSIEKLRSGAKRGVLNIMLARREYATSTPLVADPAFAEVFPALSLVRSMAGRRVGTEEGTHFEVYVLLIPPRERDSGAGVAEWRHGTALVHSGQELSTGMPPLTPWLRRWRQQRRSLGASRPPYRGKRQSTCWVVRVRCPDHVASTRRAVISYSPVLGWHRPHRPARS